MEVVVALLPVEAWRLVVSTSAPKSALLCLCRVDIVLVHRFYVEDAELHVEEDQHRTSRLSLP